MRAPTTHYTWLAGLALLAAPAAAQVGQQPEPGHERQDRGAMAVAQERQRDLAPGRELCKADDIIGKDIENQNQEDIGRLTDLVVNVSTGELEYAVVSTGGFLGIGRDRYAVPVDRLQWDPEREKLIMAIQPSEIERQHKLENNWPARLVEREGAHAGRMEEEPDVMRVDRLTGRNVRDTRGNRIGEIEDLVVDLQRGEVRYAVLRLRDFEGRDDARFAVPLQRFRPAPDDDVLILDAQRTDFRLEERLAAGRWPTRATTLVRTEERVRSRTVQESWRQDDWRRDDRRPDDRDEWRQDRRDDRDEWRQDRREQRDDWRTDRWQPDREQRRHDFTDVTPGPDRWREADRYGPQDDEWQVRDRDRRLDRTDRRFDRTDERRVSTAADSGIQQAFAAARTTTIRARVQNLRHVDGMYVAEVRTQEGETMTVHLGPKQALDQQDLEIRRGDEISLTGKQIFVPTRVQKEGRMVMLRDDRGQVQWDERRDRMDRMDPRPDSPDFTDRRAREAGFPRDGRDPLAGHIQGERAERFNGQVSNLTRKTIDREQYLVLVLRDARGSTREVALLEARQMSPQDLPVSSGDVVSVEAVRAFVAGQQVWVAKSIEVDGRRMRLRDDARHWQDDRFDRQRDRSRQPWDDDDDR